MKLVHIFPPPDLREILRETRNTMSLGDPDPCANPIREKTGGVFKVTLIEARVMFIASPERTDWLIKLEAFALKLKIGDKPAPPPPVNEEHTFEEHIWSVEELEQMSFGPPERSEFVLVIDNRIMTPKELAERTKQGSRIGVLKTKYLDEDKEVDLLLRSGYKWKSSEHTESTADVLLHDWRRLSFGEILNSMASDLAFSSEDDEE